MDDRIDAPLARPHIVIGFSKGLYVLRDEETNEIALREPRAIGKIAPEREFGYSLRPTGLGEEFTTGVKAGGTMAVGAGAHALGVLGKATGMEGLEEWGKEKGAAMFEKAATDHGGSVPSYRNIGETGNYVGDAARFAMHGLGQLAPFAVASLASGGTGAVVGTGARMAASVGLKQATTAAGRKAAIDLIGKQALAKTARRSAMVGTGLQSIGVQTGIIGQGQLEKTGDYDVKLAALGGVVTGLLDVIPEWYLIKRMPVLGEAFKGGFFKRGMKGAAVQAPLEGLTEGAQEALEQEFVPGTTIRNRDYWDQVINGTLIGAFGGGVIGGGISSFNSPTDLTQTKTERDAEKAGAAIDVTGMPAPPAFPAQTGAFPAQAISRDEQPIYQGRQALTRQEGSFTPLDASQGFQTDMFTARSGPEWTRYQAHGQYPFGVSEPAEPVPQVDPSMIFRATGGLQVPGVDLRVINDQIGQMLGIPTNVSTPATQPPMPWLGEAERPRSGVGPNTMWAPHRDTIAGFWADERKRKPLQPVSSMQPAVQPEPESQPLVQPDETSLQVLEQAPAQPDMTPQGVLQAIAPVIEQWMQAGYDQGINTEPAITALEDLLEGNVTENGLVALRTAMLEAGYDVTQLSLADFKTIADSIRTAIRGEAPAPVAVPAKQPLVKAKKKALVPAKTTMAGSELTPVEAARKEIISNGGLNLGSIKKVYSQAQVTELVRKHPGLLSKNGEVALDVVAQMHGFDSGDVLLAELLDYEGQGKREARLKSEEEAYIERMMLAEQEAAESEMVVPENYVPIAEPAPVQKPLAPVVRRPLQEGRVAARELSDELASAPRNEAMLAELAKRQRHMADIARYKALPKKEQIAEMEAEWNALSRKEQIDEIESKLQIGAKLRPWEEATRQKLIANFKLLKKRQITKAQSGLLTDKDRRQREYRAMARQVAKPLSPVKATTQESTEPTRPVTATKADQVKAMADKLEKTVASHRTAKTLEGIVKTLQDAKTLIPSKLSNAIKDYVEAPQWTDVASADAKVKMTKAEYAAMRQEKWQAVVDALRNMDAKEAKTAPKETATTESEPVASKRRIIVPTEPTETNVVNTAEQVGDVDMNTPEKKPGMTAEEISNIWFGIKNPIQKRFTVRDFPGKAGRKAIYDGDKLHSNQDYNPKDVHGAMREIVNKIAAAQLREKHPGKADTILGMFRFMRKFDKASPIRLPRTIVGRLIDRWKTLDKNFPGVTVYDTIADMPAELLAEIEAAGVDPGSVIGFMKGDTMHVIASQIETVQDLEMLVTHEVIGHYGIEKILGDQFIPIMKAIANSYKNDNRFKNLAKRLGNNLSSEKGQVDTAKEFVAEMSTGHRLEDVGFFQRIADKVRQFLHKLGFDTIYSDADIYKLLRRSEAFVNGTAKPVFTRGNDGGINLMKTDLPTGEMKAAADDKVNQSIADKLGITYNGKMGFPGKEIYLFTENTYGATFSAKAGDDVVQLLRNKVREFESVSKQDDIRFMLSDAAVPFDADNVFLMNPVKQNVQAIGKSLSHFLPKNVSRMSKFEEIFASPEYWQHPVLKKLFQIAADRTELFHQYFYDYTAVHKKGELFGNVINLLKEVKGVTWEMKRANKDWKRTGKQIDAVVNKLSDERIPWKDVREQYAKELSPEVIEAIDHLRNSYDRVIDDRVAAMEEIKKHYDDDAAARGVKPEYPTFPTWNEKGEATTMTLFEAINYIGSLKGYYAPRIREGKYVFNAHKDKADGTRELWRQQDDSRRKLYLQIERMKQEGWVCSDVSLVERMPEVTNASLRYSDIQQLINKSFERLAKNKDTELTDMDQVHILHAETIMAIRNELLSRGFRSHAQRRRTDVIIHGYERDVLKQAMTYFANFASGKAKIETAKKMSDAITPQYETVTETRPDGKQVKVRKRIEGTGIIGPEEPKIYGVAHKYIQHQLRNADELDRAIARVKQVITFKFLGLSIRAPIVNTTALIITAPAAIHTVVRGSSFAQILPTLASSMKDYVRFMASRRDSKDPGEWMTDKNALKFLTVMAQKGYDNPQFTLAALAGMNKTNVGNAFDRLVTWSMRLFSHSEQMIRGTTALAAFRLAAKQTGLNSLQEGTPQWEAAFDKTCRLAKLSSDRASASYNRPADPLWAMGDHVGAKVGQLYYMYMKFPHNYLQLLFHAGYRKKDLAAASWLLAAPIALSGPIAIPFYNAIVAMIGSVMSKLFDDRRDPEKLFWDKTEAAMGTRMANLMEGGLLGAANLNLSGSLKVGLEKPSAITDFFGVFGGLIKDINEAIRQISVGNPQRALTQLLPSVPANAIRAALEEQAGVVTLKGQPVYDREGKQLKPTVAETKVRQFLGIEPFRIYQAKQQSFRASRQLESMKTKRQRILEGIRLVGAGTQHTKSMQDLIAEIRQYNEQAMRYGGRGAGFSLITPQSIKEQFTKADRISVGALRKNQPNFQ